MIFWVLYLVAIYAGVSLFVPEIRELVLTAAILFSHCAWACSCCLAEKTNIALW